MVSSRNGVLVGPPKMSSNLSSDRPFARLFPTGVRLHFWPQHLRKLINRLISYGMGKCKQKHFAHSSNSWGLNSRTEMRSVLVSIYIPERIFERNNQALVMRSSYIF